MTFRAPAGLQNLSGWRSGLTSPLSAVLCTTRGLSFAIALLLILRVATHALFVPAYEGPDETFHLGRVARFADLPLDEAFKDGLLDSRTAAGARARPCSHPNAGCPLFGTTPASFNLLRPLRVITGGVPERNPENH